MSDPQDIPEDEALAAEFVLRLLDAEAEAAFAARLETEPELRAHVQFWEAEFSALAEDLPPVAPPASAKSGVMQRLPGADSTAKRGWSLRWFAFPALAALAVAAFFVVAPLLQGPSFDPAFHASLASADGAVRIEAGYAPDGSLFKVIPEAGSPAAGRDFELWVIGPNADAPVSLGLVPREGEALFEIPADIADLIDGGTLAVSDEPAGGSPTGAPTGDILATGDFFDV